MKQSNYQSMLAEINKLIDEKIKNKENYQNLANIHETIRKARNTSLYKPHHDTKNKKTYKLPYKD